MVCYKTWNLDIILLTELTYVTKKMKKEIIYEIKNPLLPRGGSRIFIGGGGGAQKIMCPRAHYERRAELTFGRGPVPALGPWKL